MTEMPQPDARASKIRKTLQVWLAVYPCVLLFMGVAGRYLGHWPLPLRVLVATAVIVPVVVNIAAPLVERSIQWLLQRLLERASPSAGHDGKDLP